MVKWSFRAFLRPCRFAWLHPRRGHFFAHGDRVRDVKLSPSERALSGEKTGEGMAIARKKELDEEFDRACEGRTWDIAAILPLIGCLFPAWQPGSPRLLDSPQSLDLTDPTDYWRRILAEEVGGIRDQDFGTTTLCVAIARSHRFRICAETWYRRGGVVRRSLSSSKHCFLLVIFYGWPRMWLIAYLHKKVLRPTCTTKMTSFASGAYHRGRMQI